MSRLKSNCMECDISFSYKLSQSGGKYCSNRCQQAWQYENITVPKIENGEIHGRQTLRKYLIKTRGERCEICHGEVWMEQQMPIEIDHIDGDAGNCLPINIRLLCPNCHAQQPTSKGGNRGNGRKSRGLPVD